MDVIEALNNIGANQTKELLQSAIDKFPDSTVPTDRDKRIKALENIDPDNTIFNDLDDRFYSREEYIAVLTIQHINTKWQ